MKFFHVYNDDCFVGLEKNGLINKDTGFKIQHAFSVPENRKFNKYAAKGSKLYNLIKDGKYPFYVDRLAGGITYHKYDFDKELIRDYIDMLGDWFLGFQLHESGSNRRNSDWQRILKLAGGSHGPYDAAWLRGQTQRNFAKMPDGTILFSFSQDTPEQYASMHYAETPDEYIEEMKELFTRRMAEVEGRILPCDSYYLATKIQDELGMKSFMPEVGCQIPHMRQETVLARGMAKASGKTWGTYYECWREIRKDGKFYYSMPCFNTDPSNEWYLTQELHPDDFTSHGKNGGSSRLLQNRIYYYSLMSGADYFSEEWGLNCSYSDMTDFTLSDYGEVKKAFINDALNFRNIKAVTPFAIVLPKSYSCIELQDMFEPYELGNHRDEYMRCALNASQKAYYGHIEDVLKLIFGRTDEIGNEGHVITNSRFPDVFDIIYEDATDEAFEKYSYLIDATPDASFAKSKKESNFRIIESADIGKLESDLTKLIKETMPCCVDGLCWLVSVDSNGKRYLSVFNNEGNERSLEKGDILHHNADKEITITFKEPKNINIIKDSMNAFAPEKLSDCVYRGTVPAAGFVIVEF